MFTIEKFAKSKRIPTLPEVALRLVEIAKQDDPDFAEVSQIIRSDPVVSGKVLKTVNSALFGFRHKVDTVEEAVPKLGITLLRTLILSFHLAQHRTLQKEIEPVLQAIWRCSLTQAVFAELISEHVENVDPAISFLAAMLQDIGVLAMVSESPQEYMDKVLERTELPDVITEERDHFGFSHVDVSAAIVEEWGLGESFAEAILRHHDLVAPPTANPDGMLKVVLQAANLGARMINSSRASKVSLDASLDQWVGFLKTHFGFDATLAEEMISEVNQRVGEYSVIFRFNIDEGVRADEVVLEAKDLLQEIALKNQMEAAASAKNANGRRGIDDELYRDELTNLYNRRFMNEYVNDKLAFCIKKRRPMAFLFLDVDKFKSINDTYGHAVGDKAIQHVADWLTLSIRKDDLAIRLGGDEFLVILQMVNEKNFEKTANRIASDIPKLELPEATLSISLSVGCSYYQPNRGDIADANWLIEQADQSMYRAKRGGGDGVSIQKFIGASPAVA